MTTEVKRSSKQTALVQHVVPTLNGVQTALEALEAAQVTWEAAIAVLTERNEQGSLLTIAVEWEEPST